MEHFDIFLGIASVDDATVLLFLLGLWKLKVDPANVANHIRHLYARLRTAGPLASVWADLAVCGLVSIEINFLAKGLVTASHTAHEIEVSTAVMVDHGMSSAGLEATLLGGTSKQAWLVIVMHVLIQAGMIFAFSATFGALPHGGRVVRECVRGELVTGGK